MIRNWTEKDMENLIRDSTFPNRGHKARLRGRLLEPTIELCPEDLDAAAGGMTRSEPDKDNDLPAPEKNDVKSPIL